MARLRKVGTVFLAKLFAIVMAFLGLVAGFVYAVGGAVYDIITTQELNLGTALAFGALLGMPLLFAIVGFVAGAIGAPVYNLAARWFGGIESDIEHCEASNR
jgi:hypothetical protein